MVCGSDDTMKQVAKPCKRKPDSQDVSIVKENFDNRASELTDTLLSKNTSDSPSNENSYLKKKSTIEISKSKLQKLNAV